MSPPPPSGAGPARRALPWAAALLLLLGGAATVGRLATRERPAPVASRPPAPAAVASRPAERAATPRDAPPRDDPFVPPEVLRFAAGRGPLPRPAESAPWAVSPAAGTGPAAPREAGCEPVLTEPGEDVERERRALWIERNRRRNALRIAVLQDELRLSAADAARLDRIFTTALEERVALYESLVPSNVDVAALTEGLRRIRQAQEAGLRGTLGADGYAAYERLEEAGAFALPEEKKRPQ